jgi:NAD(P)-dependent dehydrogenase (short-subunit alcohol dehydrogenase family)
MPIIIPHLTKTVHSTVYPAIDPANPKLSASGKTVIISGGASGIGYAISQGFCIAGAARVVIIARRQEALDAAATKLEAENLAAGRTTEVWTFLLDIRSTSATNAVFAAIRERLNQGATETARAGGVDADILVTSAASLLQGRTALEFDPEGYGEVFETNVGGNLNLVRAFLGPEIPIIPYTTFDGIVKDTSAVPAPPTRQKVILDVSSSAAYLSLPGQAPYAASKLAFTQVMRTFQGELDGIPGQPVRVHSFNPGTVFTPGAAKLLDEEKARAALTWDDESLPRGFTVWLASPEAAFLKGRFVMSNWDVDELVALKDKYAKDPNFGTITLSM